MRRRRAPRPRRSCVICPNAIFASCSSPPKPRFTSAAASNGSAPMIRFSPRLISRRNLPELTKMSTAMADQESQPNAELAAFGEELRRERELRGISLKEIADATKISKRFLEAIERNDHNTLPAPVFTRGFVREYARYLGLSADEIVT